MNTMLIPVIVIGSIAAVCGLILGISSIVFRTKENLLLQSIEESLPGVNCGGCGFPGCSAYAKAVSEGRAETNFCAPGGDATAQKLAQLTGKNSGTKEREVARLACFGHFEACKTRYHYDGIQTCKAANLLNGGPKACPFGCMGFGDCVRVCVFDAMTMGDNGLPVVDEVKCTGCGKCVKACPKSLYTLQKESRRVFLHCSSKDTGKEVRGYCQTGCIGCGLCAKKCPEHALTMKENLPVWDWNLCTSCGLCAEVCPKKIIFFDHAPGKVKGENDKAG